ncbi:MAG: hypothetical protein K0R27_1338 [Xanthobacteraceae bacterium]|jgi:chaperone required for assembly of F1-ATPase|nr:hypothetical protein [Xanthobacteraceae bacterium]
MAGDEPRDDMPDPVRAARGAGQMPRAKRFYKTVATAPVEGGHGVMLDGRPVRTPSRAVLAVPMAALAEALAAEWASQGEFIEPMSMPLTRLVNSARDGVAARIEETAEEIVKYAGSDLLFYRAEGPSSLVARQAAHWDPVLDFMRERLGARFVLSEGIRYVEQPAGSVAAVRAALPQDALRLAALASMTALAGSALLALGVWLGALDEEAAWTAAHVDEDHQIELWGLDAEAGARREARRREFAAAAALLWHLD